jgi:hypothetical protein
MSARPALNYEGCYTRPYQVKIGNTVRKGFAVKIDSVASDGTIIVVEAAAIGDNAIGIARDGGAALSTIRVDHFGFPGVVAALVGTGGCTAGAPAKFVADGATNATVGGATTKLVVYGQWLETGVVGDLAPLNLAAASFTVGS